MKRCNSKQGINGSKNLAVSGLKNEDTKINIVAQGAKVNWPMLENKVKLEAIKKRNNLNNPVPLIKPESTR